MDWLKHVQIEICHHSFNQSLFRKNAKQVNKGGKGSFTTPERGGNQNLKHTIYYPKYTIFHTQKNARHAKK